jgi:hypothetical protein
MGYSARYHAASLAAIFLALAVGILIGSQIGGDILDSTRKDLEASLTSDLDQARSDIDELQSELAAANEFGDRVYPPLTQLQLRGERVGLVGFGSLPSSVTDSVEEAIAPTSARLVAAGVVRLPPDIEAIAGSLGGTRFARLDRNPARIPDYGRAAGRGMVTGGRVFELSRSELMSQSSGQFGELDGLIFYRGDAGDLTAEDLATGDELATGIVEGALGTRAGVVGVEEVSTDPSSVSWFSDRGVSSVDNADQPAGKVSIVYVLAGAEGSFGIKDGSDQLLPDLLRPAPGPARQPAGGEQG